MRGKAPPYKKGGVYFRITPAHAGKSMVFLTNIDGVEDHPRTCGEKFICVHLTSSLLGSPPHMRGKAFCI